MDEATPSMRQPRNVQQEQLGPDSPVAVTPRVRDRGASGLFQVHAHCEAGVVLSGSYRMRAAGSVLTLGQGGVWWVGPWEPHEYEVLADGTEYVVVELLPSVVFSRLRSGADVPPLYLPFVRQDLRAAFQPQSSEAAQRIITAARAMRQEWLDQRPGRNGALEALLHVLLTETLRGHTFSMRPGEAEQVTRVLGALERINDNLAQPLRLGELAQQAGLGRTRFVHLFRQVTGYSCADYIVRRRLECARMEIREDRMKLDAIARRWGFYDASHLQRLYRKQYGTTPAREREARGNG
jgi:AraC-like DNA-binding protein